MPSLAVCRCLFRLMRRCFLGRWICLLFSERSRLVWKCRQFGYSSYIQFCVHWLGSQCWRRLVPNYAVVFRLGWVYSPVTLCHRRCRRIYESGNLKFTKLLQVRNFIIFKLKVFRHEERETQYFYADFSIVSSQLNQRAAPGAPKFVWPRPALNLDSLVQRQELNSLLFLKSQKSSAHASGAWRHLHPLASIPIWDFYFDISEWHILSTRAWTPALMFAPN